MTDQDKNLAQQIEKYMAAAGITQADLGRKIAPDSKNPRQSVNQYLTGRRNLLNGTAAAILDALGLELVIQPKKRG